MKKSNYCFDCPEAYSKKCPPANSAMQFPGLIQTAG